MTYVGELGWEIYLPAEFAQDIYDKIIDAGADHGLKLAGMHALNSLRLEKAYRHWGHDITEEDSPLEAGLGFAVKFDKKGGFIGRDALLKQKENKVLKRRLVQFALEILNPSCITMSQSGVGGKLWGFDFRHVRSHNRHLPGYGLR
ncbi:MAG: hypothetical protein Ct9H300mP28_24830 [Pseudomonadota bacterium]|nr:MAG: hypothetical protein Ct9H300mP28_24830 [Pseudomonadota bacterium]